MSFLVKKAMGKKLGSILVPERGKMRCDLSGPCGATSPSRRGKGLRNRAKKRYYQCHSK